MNDLARALAVLLLAPLLALPTIGAAQALELPYPTLGQPPAGANDWDCEPTRKRPVPAVLVHGTFGDQKSLLDPLSLALVDAGYCVFALDYGNRATGPIQESAKQLRRFVRKVRRATGAEKVSLVGHSQGGMMPRFYIRFLGGKRFVQDLVGIAPSNHGTTVVPAMGGAELFGQFCKACLQQSAGSPFLRRLNRGDETPGRVSYTQITTRYDEVVVPHTSGYLEKGRRTRNVTLQDVCAVDPSEHLLIPMSPTTIRLTLSALGRRGPARALTGCA